MTFKHIWGRHKRKGMRTTDIAKMQADGSRVSAVVIPLGGISGLTLSI